MTGNFNVTLKIGLCVRVMVLMPLSTKV